MCVCACVCINMYLQGLQLKKLSSSNCPWYIIITLFSPFYLRVRTNVGIRSMQAGGGFVTL